VIDALPKSAQPASKAALDEFWSADVKNRAETALAAFAKQYSAKFPKAVAKLTDDEQALLAFFDYPAEHWIHLRTTNPNRVHVRHRPAAYQGHPRGRLPQRGAGDDV
jgi:putative transposase